MGAFVCVHIHTHNDAPLSASLHPQTFILPSCSISIWPRFSFS